MPFSFLHTADWQIAKAFARLPEDASVPLRQQRIDTIKAIAQLAEQKQVNAVLVAGDVFDMSSVADKTIRAVINAMSGFKGAWLLIPGNHDPAVPEGVWTQMRRLGVPDNVHLLDQPVPFWLVEDQIVVLPAPLLRKHEANDLTKWFDTYPTAPHVVRIGLAHGSVDNRLPDRGEAPNTIADNRAEEADLDYLALGDWHGTIDIGKRIWYSGAHETDRFRDNNSGNVLHVTIDSHGANPEVTTIPVGRFRWVQLAPSLHGEDSAQDLQRELLALGEPYENLVLQVSPRGTATLSSKHKIAEVIAEWEARVHYLEYLEEGLVGEASSDELNEICGSGFIANAVQSLNAIQNDADHPDQESAQLALQLLYTEHRLLGSKK